MLLVIIVSKTNSFNMLFLPAPYTFVTVGCLDNLRISLLTIPVGLVRSPISSVIASILANSDKAKSEPSCANCSFLSANCLAHARVVA